MPVCPPPPTRTVLRIWVVGTADAVVSKVAGAAAVVDLTVTATVGAAAAAVSTSPRRGTRTTTGANPWAVAAAVGVIAEVAWAAALALVTEAAIVAAVVAMAEVAATAVDTRA